MTLLIAVCTKQMRWFAGMGSYFRRVGQMTGRSVVGNVLEFVCLGLSVPCFKVSNFFFKLTYTIQQRKLVRLGRECAGLGGDDFSVQFDDLFTNQSSIANTEQRLADLRRRIQRLDHSSNCHNVRHDDYPLKWP
jgi:hypothetical protein